jgi:hypothetical protein
MKKKGVLGKSVIERLGGGWVEKILPQKGLLEENYSRELRRMKRGFNPGS